MRSWRVVGNPGTAERFTFVERAATGTWMLLFAALGWALMVEGSDAERPSSRSPIS